MAKMAKKVNVLCMRWGNAYSKDYVNILYRAVCRNLSLPFRFICLTDDEAGLDKGIEPMPLPDMGLSPQHLAHGGWQKLCLFAPQLYDIEGRTLFLDIDIIIVGALDVFFRKKARLEIIREWRQIGHVLTGKHDLGGNSSVFAFDIGDQAHIYHDFMADKDKAFALYRNEQRFLVSHAQGRDYWQKGLCLSFKSDLMYPPPLNFLKAPRALPELARIIVFHGRPLPQEVVEAGWWGKGLRKGYGPILWAQDHWQSYLKNASY